MPRPTWKGAITFGLVHIPVTLYPAARDNDLDFTLLDKRDMSPVGYQRINKRNGEQVPWDEIVKGYEYEEDRYVVMGDEDFRQANPKATQTVDIFAFVDAERIPPYFFDKPYYLEPGRRGEKGYALLRETLAHTGKAGLANVVIRTRQHLGVVLPVDDVLVLNTMRFGEEIVPVKALTLPPRDLRAAGVSEKELGMAQRLVEDMTEEWDPERYRDTYRDDLLKRVEAKVRAHQTHVIPEPGKDVEPRQGAEIIDLVSMLRQSLERQGAARAPARKAARGGATQEEPPMAQPAAAVRPARKARAAQPQKPEAAPRKRGRG
jgi:DNA end-binding protein Ku